MLHILWLLLKIIGILLLVILGILVLLICSVCFVPIRYRGNASVSGDLSSLKAKFKFSWFLHLIVGYVIYEEKKTTWQVRIFWKRMNVAKKVKPEKLSKETFDEDGEDGDEIFFEQDEVEQETGQDTQSGEQLGDAKTEKQKCIFKRIYDKIHCTIRNIYDKIKSLIRQKRKLQKFLADETHKSAWKLLTKETGRLLKHIRPRQLRMYLHFGFEDPAVTGKTLAALSILYPFYFRSINIEPDFEKQIIEGDAFLKGYIRCVHLLVIFFHLFFDKNVQRTYKAIQNWKR